MKTQNFYVGFANPHKKDVAQVFLNHEIFCNIYVQDGSWNRLGKSGWVINRDCKALEMNFPSDPKIYDSIDEILQALEKWLAEN